ncbi:hypothetical protein PISMIDRAFT_411409 [Pisolithus microcarpus 441]|uniref:Uncharacterized protein n=1 Tax=Pisolithus microcarpus 441 TaxID=765257 RepID=A0A0C9XLL9_9AGAM|nr:hypothetical protein PISMIDRAFT_411409 [Pisolithus microcarpus 441]
MKDSVSNESPRSTSSLTVTLGMPQRPPLAVKFSLGSPLSRRGSSCCQLPPFTSITYHHHHARPLSTW